MNTGLKRTFFPIKMFFPIIALAIIGVLVYGSFFKSTPQAEADIALFYPGNCLGGWKNVDKIAGQPEVKPSTKTPYEDANSASLLNSNAQVFCGGFTGQIPESATHQKVTLNFSWYIEDQTHEESAENKDVMIEMEVVDSAVDLEQSVTTETPQEEPIENPSQSAQESSSSEGESTESVDVTEPAAFHFLQWFTSVALAQEAVAEPSAPEAPLADTESPTQVVPEEIVSVIEETSATGPVATSTPKDDSPEVATTTQSAPVKPVQPQTKEDAYFEVLYTLDGEVWNTLGFVSRIANDVQIELPIDLFSTVEDLEKVQIALHSVERFDSVPKIYLDSVWLEVIYDDVAGGELVPPGQRPGDVIFSETIYEDEKAVVVLRNVALMTLSNVLSAGSATTSTTTTPQEVASSTASTSEASAGLTDFVSTSTLASIINSTDVLVELWLYASTSNAWSRIADNSIISRNPQVKFESGSVFWVDKNNASVWRYNPRSGGYDALSFSEGEVSKLQFRDQAGELKELEFTASSSTILFNDIKDVVASPL